MDVLVANLVEAYRQSITALEWMTDETRARALDKLGPDPINDDGPEAEKTFVDNVRKRNVAIGQKGSTIASVKGALEDAGAME
ncbi:hypothetical protein IAE22_32060, partial [Bacillus sp. S34]|nr:hypothetical protein [Bacillus sp. S34]